METVKSFFILLKNHKKSLIWKKFRFWICRQKKSKIPQIAKIEYDDILDSVKQLSENQSDHIDKEAAKTGEPAYDSPKRVIKKDELE